MVQSGVLPAVLANFGTDEQKKKYLEPMLKGEKVGSLAVTESEAGNDIRNVRTTAKADGNGFVISGEKTFITQGMICDFAVVLAVTDKAKGIDGMDLFIVDRSTPGFSSIKLPKSAYRSSETAVLTLDGCRIPADAVMGGRNSQGFRGIMKTFVGERILVCGRSIGVAASAVNAANQYALERKQFGQPIGAFQAIAFRIAEMATTVEAARLFTYYAAWLWDKGKPHVQQVAMAKLFTTEAAAEITEKAMRVFGGHGLIEDAFPVQRAFMDARVSIVTVGSSDIQKRAIAKQMGLPSQ
jgi:acyl-CoA dehydrogenase